MLLITLIAQQVINASNGPVVIKAETPEPKLNHLALESYLTQVNNLRNKLWYLEWHPC
jgi:hypothetical protein